MCRAPEDTRPRPGWPKKTPEQHAESLIGQAGELLATSPQEAESLLLEAIAVAPNSAKAFFMLGQRYTRTKEYARATEAYENAVRLDAMAPDAFFNLGFVYATTGKYQAAEKTFSRAIQLRPPYLSKCLFNLAVVQQKLGKKEESMANLLQAINLKPDNPKLLAYLGQIKSTSGGASVE